MRLDPLVFIRRTRRNHAIEHATIHILSERHPRLQLAGRADRKGFFVVGQVDTGEVERAAGEAIERLDGEPELAVHPFCGTNLVVGGLVAGLAAMAAVASLPRSADGRPARALDVLPRLLLAGSVSTLLAQPLGPMAQRHLTTLPEVGGATLASVSRSERAGRTIHRVSIAEAPAQNPEREG